MNVGFDWLRRQPLSTRLIFSGAFASVSVVAYLMGRIWPWGLFMAVVPLVIGRRFSAEEDFFREVKETNEQVPVSVQYVTNFADLVAFLGRLTTVVSSGFDTAKAEVVAADVSNLPDGASKSFQFVVLFLGRPTSVKFTVKKQLGDAYHVQILSDPAFIQASQNA